MASEGLNSVGTGESVGRTMGGEGGNNGTGPIENRYPTGITSRGPELSARGADVFKGERREMSISKNRMKGRSMGDRK